MAKALLICHRRPAAPPPTDRQLHLLGARILPDNIEPRAPCSATAGQLTSAIFNPGSAARLDGVGICLGFPVQPSAGWSSPGTPAGDGCFALLRADEDRVELVADAAATRTVWYVCTEDVFIASTSQRAIVALLGDFQPSREACAWMLSSGTLGPAGGWDSRLQRVPPGGSVRLDRRAWQLKTLEAELAFEPAVQSGDEGERQLALRGVVDAAVKTLDLDFSEWLVPLSGGVDSRGVLLALLEAVPDPAALRCITWGMHKALETPGNDASVARALAKRLNVEHEYLPIELSREPSERLVERFLTAGEGRVDALSGYMDGFEVWKRLFERGVAGVIRGDEAFGWKRVRTELDVRDSIRLTLLKDYFPGRHVSSFDLPEQHIPPGMTRRFGESLATWRDRLYQAFRLPVMLAALTDLKTAYVEVLNPLLYSSVLEHARALPDEQRTDKKLWRDCIRAWSPDVPFATQGAVASLQSFMDDPGMLDLTLAELGSDGAAAILGAAPLAALRSQLEARRVGPTPSAASAEGNLSSRLSHRLRRRASRHLQHRLDLDTRVLAFRALIASRMCALLREDADFLERGRTS